MEDVNWKRPLVLAAFLALSGFFVYWFENNHKNDQDDAAEQSKKVFALKDQQIDSLSISDGTREFSFHCLDLQNQLCKSGNQSRWELTGASRQAADGASVNSLVSSLNNLTPNDTLDLKLDSEEKRSALLRDYGLSPQARPTARKIDIKLAGGKTSSIFFGSLNPLNQSIYSLVSGDGKADETRVYMISSFFANVFNEKLVHWRDKRVMIFEPGKLTGFELKDSKDRVIGEKKDGKWTVFSKKNPSRSYPGDLENVDALLTAAGYLVAKDFPPSDALKGAKSALTLMLKTPEPITLELFQKGEVSKKPPVRGAKPPEGKVYATLSGSDVVYEVDESAIGRMDKALKDLRLTRFLSSLERFAMKKIEVSGQPIGPKPLLLTMEGAKWMVSERDDPKSKREADGARVQTLLDQVAGNRIDDFVEGSNIPGKEFEKKGIELLLSDEKSQRVRHLRFWTYNFKLYARDLLSKRNEAFIVETSVSGALPWVKNFFEKKNEDPNPVPSAAKAQ